jgi:nucleotide-binding universal stress UspA family protein
VHAVHWDTLGTTLMRPSDKDLISWGRRLVRAELDRAGIRAHSVVVPGHAVDVLVRHSMYADLLVVGSPKQRLFTGRMLASTAELCALRSHCAAVLVRPA